MYYSQQRLPFTLVVPTIYGVMLVHRYDDQQTNPLAKRGIAVAHSEIVLLARLLRECDPNPIVVDVGANVGTYSLALSHVVVPKGKIHAFEPQRIIFNMLAGSIALNSITNVYCYNQAIGDTEGLIEIPQFDYNQPLNFGSVEFGPSQVEQLSQSRKYDPESVEHVPITTIDRFDWKRVDLLKVDVEGMEVQAILGAHRTIQQCRPLLYVEFVKSDVDRLRYLIADFQYELFEIGFNYLAVARERIHMMHVVERICRETTSALHK